MLEPFPSTSRMFGATVPTEPDCSFCGDWASRAFGSDGVATAGSGSPLARTRSLTWCPGCGNYILAPSLAVAK
jgi:hypothetical protein